MYATDIQNDSADQFNSARLDKPCGNSYIPKAAKCRKGRGTANQPNLRQIQGRSRESVKMHEQFRKAKANTKGIGNKIRRTGEFAANMGGAVAAGFGMRQTAIGLLTGNVGQVSRGIRNTSIGVSATSLASASKASRMGNKKLSREFLGQATKSIGIGLGQEAVLGGLGAYKRNPKRARRAMNNFGMTLSRRAAGVRTYRPKTTSITSLSRRTR